MRTQRPSRTARQVIALALVLAFLTGQSGVGADESAGSHFTHTLYLVRHGAYDYSEGGPRDRAWPRDRRCDSLKHFATSRISAPTRRLPVLRSRASR